MRHIVLVLPELSEAPGSESPLDQSLSNLEQLAERGNVFRLQPVPKIATVEALYLGMNPQEGQLAQGPLSVSAFGAEPPDPSTQFHVSVLSLVEDKIQVPDLVPTAQEFEILGQTLAKLDARHFTTIRGENLDHAAVWERSADGITFSPEAVTGKPIRAVRPEGDFENLLRRFVDDSVNLLMDSEMNRERTEAGLPPFNLFWPWGHGAKLRVPNLMLRRGIPASVETASLRLAGLARLAGYRTGSRSEFGRGLNTRFPALANGAKKHERVLFEFSAFEQFRAAGKADEAKWLAREWDKVFLEKLLEDFVDSPGTLTILSPRRGEVGIGLEFSSRAATTSNVPFRDEIVEDFKVPIRTIESVIEVALGA